MGLSQKSLTGIKKFKRLKGKTREGTFFKVQSGRITVCPVSSLKFCLNFSGLRIDVVSILFFDATPANIVTVLFEICSSIMD